MRALISARLIRLLPTVPRSSAMAMVGHLTESIYRRYAITDEAMLREAALKLAVSGTQLEAEQKTAATASNG